MKDFKPYKELQAIAKDIEDKLKALNPLFEVTFRPEVSQSTLINFYLHHNNVLAAQTIRDMVEWRTIGTEEWTRKIGTDLVVDEYTV